MDFTIAWCVGFCVFLGLLAIGMIAHYGYCLYKDELHKPHPLVRSLYDVQNLPDENLPYYTAMQARRGELPCVRKSSLTKQQYGEYTKILKNTIELYVSTHKNESKDGFLTFPLYHCVKDVIGHTDCEDISTYVKVGKLNDGKHSVVKKVYMEDSFLLYDYVRTLPFVSIPYTCGVTEFPYFCLVCIEDAERFFGVQS